MKRMTRSILAAAAVFCGVWASPVSAVDASPQAAPVVLTQQAKSQAMQALAAGEVARGRKLLEDAASRSEDGSLRTIAGWMREFEQQYDRSLSERRAAYEKAEAQVKFLVEKGKLPYASDAATRAYTLAIDKRAFANEPWVAPLIREVQAAAHGAERAGDWRQAQRLYLNLSAIEPSNPAWKELLKRTTQRFRLLGMYVPQRLAAASKERFAEDAEVEKLLRSANLMPTTQPAREAATRPVADDMPEAKSNWREALKDIRYDMLWTTLEDSVDNYYRELDYAKLVSGGIRALREVATLEGLEAAFPALKEEIKKKQFLAALDEASARAAGVRGDDGGAFRRIVVQLRAANRVSLDLPEEVFVSEFIEGALGELDPFSAMIWPSIAEDFSSMTEGEFAGVGIRIERDETRSLRVISPMEDSPAYEAGIKAGDLILRVNGEGVQDLLLEQAVKKIKGPPGTQVTLTVQTSEGTTRDFVLKRATIKVASVMGWMRTRDGSWDYMLDPVEKVGYMRLASFARQSSAEMDAAIRQMQAGGARGMIIDLRSDGGGLLTAAIEIADKFMKKGAIVSTRAERRTPQQPTIATAQLDRNEVEMPLVIMVNQFSASASEILAGALKDHGRALIVGERTFGKGSVQNVFPIAGKNAALKLTTSHYYLPSGRCVHREEDSAVWGVDPDLAIEMTPEQMRTVLELRQQLDVLSRSDIAATSQSKKPEDLLSADPQLSGALLLMRLHLAGGQLAAPDAAQAKLPQGVIGAR
jgi:carboxyl-terminal processing protease